jgi:hypothetical protein
VSLPKLVTPEHTIELPSTGEKVNFRPFLVKEEKILLTALEAGENSDIVKAIKQVMTNCILSDLDVDNISFFDFEYLFLMLRSKSVGNGLDLTLLHNCEDPGIENKVMVDLDTIKVKFPKEHTSKIMIDDVYGVKMKYPTIKDSEKYQNMSNENLLEILGDFIEFVYDKDNVYDEFTEKEMSDFVESMNKSQLENIMTFFNNMPSLKHDLTYTCKKCKKTVTHKIAGLNSFFT